MTKTVPSLLFLTLIASTAPACTVAGGEEEEILEEGEVVLASPDDEGKSDTVFGKTLRYNLRGTWPWTTGDDSMITDTEVLQQTNNMMRVRALRIEIGMPATELLEVSVDAESFNDLGEISTDMAFILWTADANRSYWRPTFCPRNNYFERVIIDRDGKEMDVVARTADGDIARTFSFSECGIPADVSQVALLAFPSSGWWSLEGYYHLKVEADCGTEQCPAPKPVFVF
ncbi:MAG TPA: hypothetical protein VFU21_15170 [Kofleriaceae bacterium]|nr:hypothetical protein [Kofleriaceae bacterium]